MTTELLLRMGIWVTIGAIALTIIWSRHRANTRAIKQLREDLERIHQELHQKTGDHRDQ